MKKEELLKDLYKLKRTTFKNPLSSFLDYETISLADVIALVERLNEPEKVAIPRFVAEAFEKAKVDNWFASSLINVMYDSSDEVAFWLEVPSNEKLLLRAWLDGYEIEKEKLYYVVDGRGQMLLFKSQDLGINRSNGVDFEKVLKVYGHEPSNMYQLTEKEIRDYDARFMLFMIESAE